MVKKSKECSTMQTHSEKIKLQNDALKRENGTLKKKILSQKNHSLKSTRKNDANKLEENRLEIENLKKMNLSREEKCTQYE